MARDPFVEEYQKGMAAVRKSRPKKRKLSLGKAAEKRDTLRDELSVEKYRQERNPQTQGTGTLTAGYDPMTDRAIRAIGSTLGNSALERNLRAVDENLIGGAAAERAAFNVGRGEGTGWDALDLALAAPLAGTLAKPVGLAARGVKAAARAVPGAERVAGMAARAGASRPAQYLREARPLVDNADDAIQTAFTVTPGAQRRITNRRVTPRGLPAPEQRLGLPAPGPGLPEWAAKPRGGNWWPETADPYGVLSPKARAKDAVYMTERFQSNPEAKALVEWWDRALPRYLQNDYGTPDDPLRAMAEQGYIPGVANAAQWSGIASKDIVPMPLQKLLFDDKAEAARKTALEQMPWINKLPATDTMYGLQVELGSADALRHVKDEMQNALRAQEVGLPADLAVRPESLARMSFPQAVERVGRINQWRAKQAEQAKLSALNSPALSVFKEYPDDPRGLRWVELRAPDTVEIPEGYGVVEKPKHYAGDATGYSVQDIRGDSLGVFSSREAADDFLKKRFARSPLQEALRYEGDTMGHCVGGYCDDVLQGRSRIFSLRDAKGEPHVTIETAPSRPELTGEQADALHRQAFADFGVEYDDTSSQSFYDNLEAINDRYDELVQNRPNLENIVQIKGKQNLAPKEDYLPFVQDFVKGGQWGEIGDLGNTGLVKLPDGRFVTKQQFDSVMNAPDVPDWLRPDGGRGNIDATQLLSERFWAPHVYENEVRPILDRFNGFARGGRVQSLAVKPCSCDKSLAVR